MLIVVKRSVVRIHSLGLKYISLNEEYLKKGKEMNKKLLLFWAIIILLIATNVHSSDNNLGRTTHEFFVGMGREVGGGFGGGYTLRLNNLGITLGLGHICKEYCGYTYAATLKKYVFREKVLWVGLGYGTTAYFQGTNADGLYHGVHFLVGINQEIVNGLYVEFSLGLASHEVPESLLYTTTQSFYETASVNLGYQFTRRKK